MEIDQPSIKALSACEIDEDDLAAWALEYGWSADQESDSALFGSI